MRMHWTGEMVIAMVVAVIGFIATGTNLVMQLRIQKAVAQIEGQLTIKIEKVRLENSGQHARVELQIEQLKTKYAESAASNYLQITSEMRRDYMDKSLADEKHRTNVDRLEKLAEGQRDLREAMERRLLSIEERLPV